MEFVSFGSLSNKVPSIMKLATKVIPGEIMTQSGIWINPLDPDPEKIRIEDISHSLSNQCRFTGHTKYFYSVAQHSVLVSQICDYEDALWGLLHDGTEAYLSDIARPIKRMPGFGTAYLQVEDTLLEAIGERFDLPAFIPDSVRWADNVLLRSEMRDLMPKGIGDAFDGTGDFLDLKIKTWSPSKAKAEFLKRYEELTND